MIIRLTLIKDKFDEMIFISTHAKNSLGNQLSQPKKMFCQPLKNQHRGQKLTISRGDGAILHHPPHFQFNKSKIFFESLNNL